MISVFKPHRFIIAFQKGLWSIKILYFRLLCPLDLIANFAPF